jgi:hypothetical protein
MSTAAAAAIKAVKILGDVSPELAAAFALGFVAGANPAGEDSEVSGIKRTVHVLWQPQACEDNAAVRRHTPRHLSPVHTTSRHLPMSWAWDS